MTTVAPYGSWISPLSAADASAAGTRFDGARFVGDEVWWGESVAAEGGRSAVRRSATDGTVRDVLPAPWDARSRVHEYGGGAWTASPDGILFFVEKTDQRIWSLVPGQEPVALTPEDPAARHGGLRWQHGVLLAVREQHGDHPVPSRSIVRIPLEGGAPVEVVAGSDFVAQPALSPGGDSLAWVAWNHPDMPWDRTEVRVGSLVDGRVTSWRRVSSGTTAALQPEWDAEGRLVFVDDPSGRWNLWRTGDAPTGTDGAPAVCVAPADADTGGGLWVLGSRWYAPLADGFAAVRTNGSSEIVLVHPDGSTSPTEVPVRDRAVIEDAAVTRVLVSGSAPGVSGVWLVEADGRATLVRGSRSDLDERWIPSVREVTVAGPHGEVHAYDHPPTNPGFTAPDGELPPYVVLVHGGPTAHVGGVADSKTTFFTSRGIGVLDVNYGGSTGYGRAYRDRLHGQWGVVDRDDVAAVASGLAAEGRADSSRIAIEGGSAGGWTVLSALARTDVFAAGISRYGVGDARLLATDTHDFEARYLDGLIGPLPEAEDLYVERSPLTHTDGFSVPVLLLQGQDDAVVPPSQAEAIRDALAARGVPHAYVLYPGEGHGFRRAETVVHSLETELAFLGQVFGFDTPGVAEVALE
ncbi:prolyl oligopeptidase family serine peptidase [Microbacterium sp. EYE_5]|uniref:dipeptidyl-peptidase 5 n=1 Tax=unclassified Microbacterium TaxID=2609290 RepID=UPI00200559BD|nr:MULTISPECIES: prolyl oligopeptidase family serine peptidase [unclassified Microbacterium]MCK6081869.1 prolyl oligopeptidase family serine peptidase [Microbacterium sp. EYE_382]MCK6087139.1 prolyl oligopeptidase family serine peptidase [Microbacterium sp. EYE_384]MCK6124883.1 prolyl oligopeptidase family serine peptidase [Microbacterium sp. EYE_80]MCK6127902.1 prolyl oligopeptidase family serine peptidase [Microbacterium sp. EYE_79]MCK6142823.1 prolyl oligopeptidase family serine peptidase [